MLQAAEKLSQTLQCQFIINQPVPWAAWNARSTSAPASPNTHTGGLHSVNTPSTPLSVLRLRKPSACLPPVTSCQAQDSIPSALCTAVMQTELFANRPPEHNELGWNQLGTPAALLASICLLQWQNMCAQQCVIEYSSCMQNQSLYAAQNVLLGGCYG